MIALIAFNVHLLLTVRKLENKYRRFMKGRDGISLEDQFIHEFDKLSGFDDGLAEVKAQVAQLRAIEQKNMTKYGVVKYDAFEDVGGRLSFVLALLNEEDSGIVLNAIHSKDNCFLYLKEVVKGESYIMLSSEEVQALRNAKSYDSEAEVDNIMSTIEEAAGRSGSGRRLFGKKLSGSDKTGAPLTPEKTEPENDSQAETAGFPAIADPSELPDLPENADESAAEALTGDGSYGEFDGYYEPGNVAGADQTAEANPYTDISESIGGDFSAKMKELMHEPGSYYDEDLSEDEALKAAEDAVDWLDD